MKDVDLDLTFISSAIDARHQLFQFSVLVDVHIFCYRRTSSTISVLVDVHIFCYRRTSSTISVFSFSSVFVAISEHRLSIHTVLLY